MNFNQEILEELPNEFGGSDKKQTVVLAGSSKKYLLKLPDPTREKGKKEKLSYINNVFSEYIGCMISKSVGLPVQEVILGEYTFENSAKTVPACACGDIRNSNEILYEIDKQELRNSLEETDSRYITFESVNRIFSFLEKYGLDKKELEKFYFDMFVLDALIGNTDRHNGNWGFLMAPNSSARIAPVYDCGSSLFPIASDDMLKDANIRNIALGTYSAIRDENMQRINYHEIFTEAENSQVNKALKRMLPRINMAEIYGIIDGTPYLSEVRKDFYKEFVRTNYEQTLVKGLVNVMAKEIPEKERTNPEIDYYAFYQKNIRCIKDLPEFVPHMANISGKSFRVMRVSSQYAITFDDTGATSIFFLQSNDSKVKRTMEIFQYLGANKIFEENKKGCDSEQSEEKSRERSAKRGSEPDQSSDLCSGKESVSDILNDSANDSLGMGEDDFKKAVDKLSELFKEDKDIESP
ncbi:MAG: HipA domain-containing protein [Acetatifactor sp.]|nr:HipA domain-containing protein [Acetatifactor sp.]